MRKYPHLSAPITVRGITLKNRILATPIQSDDGGRRADGKGLRVLRRARQGRRGRRHDGRGGRQ